MNNDLTTMQPASGRADSAASAHGPCPRPEAFSPLWRIARELRARPLALEPSAFAAIDRQLSAAIALRAAGGPHAGHDRAPDTREQCRLMPGGVAVVELHGVLGRHLSQLDMDCGGCDVDAFADSFRAAVADPAVRAVVIDADSPGGSVCGVADAADLVRAAPVPVVAYAADLCASAAYWIASAARSVICGQTAEIGSVGVYCAVLDRSVAYERDGLRVELFASGEHKGAGVPGTSLTDAQRELMQADVDYLASVFRAAVLARRDIDAALLDGRTLTGGNAVAANFADAVGTLGDAAQLAAAMADMEGTRDGH